ncbi:MAG: hypothetical protein ACTHN3_02500 [Solirubrobacterales bacterium]
MGSERGQGTVEWVGTLLVVSVAMLGLVAAGVRVPGASLARAVADRILCAAALADECGDETDLIAAYGSEVGGLVRRHMPTLAFEPGSKAVPVDFRSCRSSECGDSSAKGSVHVTDEGLPVTVFVHVVDCREERAEQTEREGADCSGDRAGNLYVQYRLFTKTPTTSKKISEAPQVVGEDQTSQPPRFLGPPRAPCI